MLAFVGVVKYPRQDVYEEERFTELTMCLTQCVSQWLGVHSPWRMFLRALLPGWEFHRLRGTTLISNHYISVISEIPVVDFRRILREMVAQV